MLEAEPSHWYSRNYVILQNGQRLAEIKRGLFREQGSITVGGQTCRIRRDGLTGPFLYEVDGTVLARAWIHSFRRFFDVEYEGQRYKLRARSRALLARTFVLERDGEVIGTIRPKSLFGRKLLIEMSSLPPTIALFLFWLVMIQLQREEAAAAGGAVAASG
ncbi:hypothetical protein [Thermogemmatispora sp.]|uniref:hypothetical protein n=1 Tax=Thermogemmatispora sp. TaxID=1968838 RepID=UPI0035E43087